MDILYYFTPEDSRYTTDEGIECKLCIKVKSVMKTMLWVSVGVLLVVLLGQ